MSQEEQIGGDQPASTHTEIMNRSKFRHVNIKMIPIKINFFCQYFAIGSFFMYVNPILETLGLSSSQLGTAALVANAVGTFSRIVFGIISDRTNKRNLVMTVLSAATAACVFSFFAFPKPIQYVFTGTVLNESVFALKALEENENTNVSQSILPVNWPTELISCTSKNLTDLAVNLTLLTTSTDRQFAVYSANNTNTSVGDLVWPSIDSLITRFPTELKCAAIGRNNTLTYSQAGAIIPGKAALGVVIAAMVLRTIVSTLDSPLLNLLDSTTYDMLGEEKSDMYGRSRLFGSLGFVVSSLVTGLCISKLSSGASARVRAPDYSPSLICAGVSLLLATLFSVYPSQGGQTGRSTHFLKATALALRSKEMVVCLLTAFLSGMIMSLYGEYMFLILTRQYGVPHFVLGILVSVIVVSEIPSFSISGYALKRLGPTLCIVLAHVCWAIAFFLYGYLVNYWYLLIPQALCGVAFPFLYNALLTESANVGRQCKIGESNAISTMHGLVTAVMFGVTSSIGGLVWGVLLDYYSGRTIFFIASVYCSILVGLIPIIWTFILKSACFPNECSESLPTDSDETQAMLSQEIVKTPL